MALLSRIGAAVLLGIGTYIVTVYALGYAIDWLGEQHPLRSMVGTLWVASQPFIFGVFFLAAEIVIWYCVLPSLIRRIWPTCVRSNAA